MRDPATEGFYPAFPTKPASEPRLPCSLKIKVTREMKAAVLRRTGALGLSEASYIRLLLEKDLTGK